MANDQLFKRLCSSEVMRIGWHLAQDDSRDDFVTDPIGHADFAASVDLKLKYVIEQVEKGRYRPQYLLEVDIPKTGLSVRPGHVLPIEEMSLLHAIVYLLAPRFDVHLDDSVYSYRLHRDWQKKAKKGRSLFKDAEESPPFLRHQTIRKFAPFEPWYEAWPEFEAAATAAVIEEGYTHLTKTDISSYFENIDLRLLETQLRDLLKTQESQLLQVLFTVLGGWTRSTAAGVPIGRGIPQGNDVSSFFGNLYLFPLDRAIKKFCRKKNAKWFRYVDDVKIFTHSEADAREAVFVVNSALRSLHLTLQGKKTEILSGADLMRDLDESELRKIDDVRAEIRKRRLDPRARADRREVTQLLKPLSEIASRFNAGLPGSIKKLSTKENRTFRRLMTVYGECNRRRLRPAAIRSLHELPDPRVLKKSLRYLRQIDDGKHNELLDHLLNVVVDDTLPFPYQTSTVLDTIVWLHPQDPSRVASGIRQFLRTRKRDWVVSKAALEVIFAYPYLERHWKL